MAVIASTAEDLTRYYRQFQKDGRGYSVYNLTDTVPVTAIDKRGNLQTVTYERPQYTLSISERIGIARMSAMVFGVIASRMNRVGALDWHIREDQKETEKEIEKMDMLYGIFKEWEDVTDPRAQTMRGMIVAKLRQRMPDLRMDMQNFRQALMRYRKRCDRSAANKTQDMEEWLTEPNADHSFEEFLKMWMWDLHVHGSFAYYKQAEKGVVNSLHPLPGGTVTPLKDRFVGGAVGYVQTMPTEATPQLMFNDEVSFSRWLPTTAASYGMVPLEALVNKVSEQLLFDQKAASEADGTKPPEKAVVFSEDSPFGDLDQALDTPMDSSEQKRVEMALNEQRQHVIRTLSGVGTPTVLDLSRSDIFASQSQRQEQLKQDVALVFGASNSEVNLTGSENTSGRATSESEERIEYKRGMMPLLKIIEDKLNRDVLPFRFGPGFKFEFDSGMSEAEQTDMAAKKNQSGVYAVNEVRAELGLDPFPEDEYDRPQTQQVADDREEGEGGLLDGLM